MQLTKSFSKILTTGLLALGGMLSVAPSAEALKIEFEYAEGTPYFHQVAAETAASMVEALVKDDVTLRYYYKVDSYNDFGQKDVLGIAVPAFQSNVPINQVYLRHRDNLMEKYGVALNTWQDGLDTPFCTDNQYGDEYYNGNGGFQCTNLDYYSLGFLRDVPTVVPRVNSQGYSYDERQLFPYFHPNQTGSNRTTNFLLTRSQLKALDARQLRRNDIGNANNRLDGAIIMNDLNGAINPYTNSPLRWAGWLSSQRTNNTNPFRSNHLSLPTTIAQEIMHQMGIISSIDLVDNQSELTNANARARQVTWFDSYRYGEHGYLDLHYGSDIDTRFYAGPIFVNPNGTVRVHGSFSAEQGFVITDLSRGLLPSLGGDGAQGSHPEQEITSLFQYERLPVWERDFLIDNNDVSAPFSFTGWSSMFSATDAQLLQAVGWNVDYRGYRSQDRKYYTTQGVQRANEIRDGIRDNLLDTQETAEREEDVLVLFSSAIDAITNNAPSYDESQHLYDQNSDLVTDLGLNQRTISSRGRRRGLTQRSLNRISYMRALRNSLTTTQSPAATFNSTLNVAGLDNSNPSVVRFYQKGIFQNRAIFEPAPSEE